MGKLKWFDEGTPWVPFGAALQGHNDQRMRTVFS